MDSLVSIIIPVYNKASHIRETLDCALGQTYPNVEIVLINDGSVDGSLDILKEFNLKFPDKIVLVDQENKGVSAATNVGIKASKGDYIQFLDADDLMSSDKVENQINLLKGKPFTTISSCEWVNFNNNIENFSRINYGVFQNFDTGINWLLRAWNHQEMMADSSWLTHRNLIDRAGPWDETLIINQDGEFFSRVLVNANEVLYDRNSKIYYRKPEFSNVSQSNSEKALKSLLNSYQAYEKNVLKVENSARIRRALKKVYQKFIYDVFPKYPHLISKAEELINDLNIPEKTYIGGPKFQQMSRIFGFKNALRLKRLI